jgi:hypothetical protein
MALADARIDMQRMGREDKGMSMETWGKMDGR